LRERKGGGKEKGAEGLGSLKSDMVSGVLGGGIDTSSPNLGQRVRRDLMPVALSSQGRLLLEGTGELRETLISKDFRRA